MQPAFSGCFSIQTNLYKDMKTKYLILATYANPKTGKTHAKYASAQDFGTVFLNDLTVEELDAAWDSTLNKWVLIHTTN